jgi:hypothetical protein
MECLAATYQWQTTEHSARTVAACTCGERSADQREVQRMRAGLELRQMRDRVRKAITKSMEGANSLGARVRVDWQVTPDELAQHLCFWQHSSALSRVDATACLAELVRYNRRAEGAGADPPASKCTLMLVVWGVAARVRSKLWEWRECVAASEEASFDGRIVVRAADVLPIWAWEADVLRAKPALTDVCSRLLAKERCTYRQRCEPAEPSSPSSGSDVSSSSNSDSDCASDHAAPTLATSGPARAVSSRHVRRPSPE